MKINFKLDTRNKDVTKHNQKNHNTDEHLYFIFGENLLFLTILIFIEKC